MKSLRFLLFCIAMICCAGNIHSQELKVVAFQRMDRDLLARTQERLDLNDVPCAIVRVSVANAKEFTFEGNVIGDVVYRPGEALVYMTEGSRNLTIKSDAFGSLKYEFTQKLDKQVVYKLELRLETPDSKKTRTMVMPVVGIGSTTSFGLMVGVVKKWGWYLKAKYDFKNQETVGECDDAGLNMEGTPMWFTGETASSRMAITTGAMYRVAKPLYLYLGAGYGYKKLAWEMAEGESGTNSDQWAENQDETFKGIEADLGLVLRMKNIALSAGLQSNSFKYFEATVGLGIMF